jgi:hypothetical protein
MPTRKGHLAAPESGISLTPEVLAAAYDYLRLTAPFNRWKLPPSSKVKFRVTRSRKEAGWCDSTELQTGKICIGVSDTLHGHSASLLTTMAHEMCHIRQAIRGENLTHGAGFCKLAAQICAKHGFDLLGF